MLPFLTDWLDELIMPDPNRDDRLRSLKRLVLGVGIAAASVWFFG